MDCRTQRPRSSSSRSSAGSRANHWQTGTLSSLSVSRCARLEATVRLRAREGSRLRLFLFPRAQNLGATCYVNSLLQVRHPR